MTTSKVLFVDTAHPALIQGLTALGYQCDYFESYTRNDYKKIVGNYCGIIIRSKIKLDEEMLSLASSLKFIGRVGAGMENIDVEVARKNGVLCINAPEGNRDAVGEHALGMLLSLLNHLNRVDAEVRKGIWIREGNRGIEVKGKTVGIIGYGNMGGAFAQRLSGFGAHVIAYDKYKTGYSDEFVEAVEMETFFETADIVSLHVPLTDETRFLVNAEWLGSFKKDIFLINTARGPVVKTDDLVAALESGKVRGAALDVMEYEKLSFENLDAALLPPAFHYLITSNKVLLSPHIAGWTLESNVKLAQTIVDKVAKAFH